MLSKNYLECKTYHGVYKLINGKLYHDYRGRHVRILDFCLNGTHDGGDDPFYKPIVTELPMFVVE